MFISRKKFDRLSVRLQATEEYYKYLFEELGKLRVSLDRQAKELDDARTRVGLTQWPAEQVFSVPIQGIPTAAPVIKSTPGFVNGGSYQPPTRRIVPLNDLVRDIANILKIEWQPGTDGRLVAGKKAK